MAPILLLIVMMKDILMSGKNGYPLIDHCSDIHFFHPKVPIENIITTMESFYPLNSTTEKLDIISIGGDLFDTTILFSSQESREFVKWAIRFLLMCKKLDIEVWVLEGTPRHDRLQSEWLITLNEANGIHAPIKYFKGIEYYYCKRIDKHVLFIQDELTTNPDLTYQLAVETIRNSGHDKVDIISMHGMFDYQAPENVKIHGIHNAKLYMNLVNDFILCGHVHKPSFYDKIIVAGSSTRLKHGEEEAKGHVRIEYINQHEYRATFLENTHAMVFSDLVLTDKDKENASLVSRLSALPYPRGSYVRVVCGQEDSNLFPLSLFSEIRPDYNWSKKELKGNKQENNPIFEELALLELEQDVEINKSNVLSIIESRLSTRYDETTINGCLSVLKEVI
jgi:DNA repair exonuclease SbcCD nuclease subunit